MTAHCCCLCGRSISTERSQVVEKRPTGDSGEFEEWFYCPSCWLEMKKLRQKDRYRKSLLQALNLSVELDED